MSPPRLVQPACIDDLLLYRLNRLVSVAGSMVIRLCEGRFGITRREWRLLAVLAAEDELLSSQLAERAQLDRARTSRAITSLAAKKLVRRQAGAADRRQARVALTPEGQALYGEMFPLVCAINQALLQPVPAGDVATLDAWLDGIQQQADRLVQQAELPKADRRRGGRLRVAAN
ncbi:MAG: MarR family winged helix-turn-helix transcriptional regulator [Ramlibacter sp.]